VAALDFLRAGALGLLLAPPAVAALELLPPKAALASAWVLNNYLLIIWTPTLRITDF